MTAHDNRQTPGFYISVLIGFILKKVAKLYSTAAHGTIS
jgi:hypothetical protein